MENAAMKITGIINYEITVHDNGDTEIEYEPKIEDEIASLCIAQKVVNGYTEYLNEERGKHSGKTKKAITNVLNDVMRSKLGLNHVVDFMCGNYKAYSEHLSAEPKLKVTQEQITYDDIQKLKEQGVIK